MLTEDAAAELSPEGWLVELERLQVYLNQMDVYGAWLFARAEAAGAAAVMGERSLVDALRKRLGISKFEAQKRRRTAEAASDERIRSGMESGDLNADQAADLSRADVPEDVRDELIDEAKIGADDADATRKKVKDAERQAAKDRGEDPTSRQRKRRSAKRFVDADGMWNLHLSLDPETGAQIDAALSAEHKRLWHADKDAATAAERTPAQRLADAATNLLLGGAASGSTGGRRAKPDLVVTIGLDDLRPGSGSTGAETNGGVPLGIETIRRHACDTNLIPAVLGSRGEVLDLGRTVRLVTKAQRRALAIRDGGCIWPGCDQPPAACDAHHVHPWSIGGSTDLGNLALLCHTHHHLCHEGGYELWAHPPEQGRLGWMIHDSGGIPRWPTEHRQQDQHRTPPARTNDRRDSADPTRPEPEDHSRKSEQAPRSHEPHRSDSTDRPDSPPDELFPDAA